MLPNEKPNPQKVARLRELLDKWISQDLDPAEEREAVQLYRETRAAEEIDLGEDDGAQ